jgi:tRNA pseudouridine55 synthase
MGKRRQKGRPVNGWLVLDKPYDFGSTEAVSRVKRLFDAQKAGHAGTLDPLATGILPIALGEATKTVPYVMDATKRYRFTARWGVATSTDDGEGEAIAQSPIRPDARAIQAALPAFTGTILQTPPQFSAVKIGGERAYDLARDGKEVVIEPREIDIHALRLVSMIDDDHAEFEATTGKGAYVRALVRDLARALGTEGHVSALRRIAVGPFSEEDSSTLEEIEALADPDERAAALLPVSAALAGAPEAPIGGPECERLRRGQPAVIAPSVAKGIRGDASGLVPTVLATRDGAPVAICELDGLKLAPLRVFNL